MTEQRQSKLNRILWDMRYAGSSTSTGVIHKSWAISWADAIEASIEAEVQRRIAEMGENPVAWMRHRVVSGAGGFGGGVAVEFSEQPFGGFDDPAAGTNQLCDIEPLYAAPPQAQLQAEIDQAREEALTCYDRALACAASIRLNRQTTGR